MLEMFRADRFRNIVLPAVSALLAIIPTVSAAKASKQPPNILLVIADDMGLDASPCHALGKHKPKMPVLERMCREGIVFENTYSAPTCSPTRATIMTGRYGFRTGVGTVVRPGGGSGLKLSEKTIFQFLDEHTDKGYAHAVIGKWHLSDASNGGAKHPEKAGVGYYAGVLRGRVRDYYNWPRTHEGKTTQISSYITSALTNEASRWINRQRKPWFLWLAHVAPHFPLHLPPKNLHSRFELNGERPDLRAKPRQYYFAALEAMDKELGKLLSRMPKSVRDDTIVIFIGDNGTPGRVAQAYPRRRAKGRIFDGGTRVPMIVWGKNVLRRGARERALVNTTDLFASIVELAGVNIRKAKMPEDSVSFAALLTRSVKTGRDFAYVEHFGPETMQGPNRASRRTRGAQSRRKPSDLFGFGIRDARWKYIDEKASGRSLFDLSKDPLEKVNLLANGKVRNKQAQAALRRLKARLTKLRNQK